MFFWSSTLLYDIFTPQSIVIVPTTKENKMTDLSEKTEEFIAIVKKGSSKEIDEKLFKLIEEGIDPEHIRYCDGWQRMDDGYRWGNAYYLLMYVLEHCSLNVMKKLFDKYPQILDQVTTRTHSTYRGYSDAYWLRGLNDGNGEEPVVRDSEIASYLIEKLSDFNTRCLRNAFAKLSFDDCMKLLENPNVSEAKKSILLQSRDFNVDTPETLLSLRPYADKIQKITFDLAGLSNQEVLSFLSSKKEIETITFLNFPTDEKDQRVFISKLADMEYERARATDKDDKGIDLRKLVNEERQRRVEEANEGKADWKIDFLKKYAVKDFRAALGILQREGKLSGRITTSKSNFGREFDLSPLGWGNNSLEVQDDLIAVDIKDMGNGTFAIGRIYEDRKWRSTVDYHSGIGWWWQADIAIVNLDKGIGPIATTSRICVRHPEDVSRDIFGNIPREDFVSVDGDTAGVSLGGYASARVKKPAQERTGKSKLTGTLETTIIKSKFPPVNGGNDGM